MDDKCTICRKQFKDRQILFTCKCKITFYMCQDCSYGSHYSTKYCPLCKQKYQFSTYYSARLKNKQQIKSPLHLGSPQKDYNKRSPIQQKQTKFSYQSNTKTYQYSQQKKSNGNHYSVKKAQQKQFINPRYPSSFDKVYTNQELLNKNKSQNNYYQVRYEAQKIRRQKIEQKQKIKQNQYYDDCCKIKYQLFELAETLTQSDKDSINVKLPNCKCTRTRQQIENYLHKKCLICGKHSQSQYSAYFKEGYITCYPCFSSLDWKYKIKYKIDQKSKRCIDFLNKMLYRCALCQGNIKQKRQFGQPPTNDLNQVTLCSICYHNGKLGQKVFQSNKQWAQKLQRQEQQRRIRQEKRRVEQEQRRKIQQSRNIQRQRQRQRQRNRIYEPIKYTDIYNRQRIHQGMNKQQTCGICYKHILSGGIQFADMIICQYCKSSSEYQQKWVQKRKTIHNQLYNLQKKQLSNSQIWRINNNYNKQRGINQQQKRQINQNSKNLEQPTNDNYNKYKINIPADKRQIREQCISCHRLVYYTKQILFKDGDTVVCSICYNNQGQYLKKEDMHDEQLGNQSIHQEKEVVKKKINDKNMDKDDREYANFKEKDNNQRRDKVSKIINAQQGYRRQNQQRFKQEHSQDELNKLYQRSSQDKNQNNNNQQLINQKQSILDDKLKSKKNDSNNQDSLGSFVCQNRNYQIQKKLTQDALQLQTKNQNKNQQCIVSPFFLSNTQQIHKQIKQTVKPQIQNQSIQQSKITLNKSKQKIIQDYEPVLSQSIRQQYMNKSRDSMKPEKDISDQKDKSEMLEQAENQVIIPTQNQLSFEKSHPFQTATSIIKNVSLRDQIQKQSNILQTEKFYQNILYQQNDQTSNYQIQDEEQSFLLQDFEIKQNDKLEIKLENYQQDGKSDQQLVECVECGYSIIPSNSFSFNLNQDIDIRKNALGSGPSQYFMCNVCCFHQSFYLKKVQQQQQKSKTQSSRLYNYKSVQKRQPNFSYQQKISATNIRPSSMKKTNIIEDERKLNNISINQIQLGNKHKISKNNVSSQKQKRVIDMHDQQPIFWDNKDLKSNKLNSRKGMTTTFVDDSKIYAEQQLQKQFSNSSGRKIDNNLENSRKAQSPINLNKSQNSRNGQKILDQKSQKNQYNLTGPIIKSSLNNSQKEQRLNQNQLSKVISETFSSKILDQSGQSLKSRFKLKDKSYCSLCSKEWDSLCYDKYCLTCFNKVKI